MTLTILVSFSLLALVATARPAFPNNFQEPSKRSVDVQHAVQDIFQSRTGRLPNEDDEDVQIHITSSEQQRAYLSSLDELDEIKAIVPLGSDGVFTEEEKKLYNILSDTQTGKHLDDLDGGIQIPQDMTPRTRDALFPAEPPERVEATQDQIQYTSSYLEDFLATRSLLVLAVACIGALLVTLCVGTALYFTKYLRSSLLSSNEAWVILPRLEQHGAVEGPDFGSDGEGGTEDDEKAAIIEQLTPGTLLSESVKENDIKVKSEEEPLDLISFDDDELEEKFHDAEDHLLIFPDDPKAPAPQGDIEIPRVVVDFADPELLPLPRSDSPFYTPPRTPIHTPPRSPVKPALQMRAARPGSPASIPAWSLRAADSPSFAVPDSTPTSLRMPGALFPDSLSAMESPDHRVSSRQTSHSDSRSRIDIALALQLRPGLGLGADPAWLVRFLMAMFGWMTVLIGGGGIPN